MFLSVKVLGLKEGKVITDMKVSSSERGDDNTQYSAVLLCIMQLVFWGFYLSFGLRGSEAQEGLMYLLLPRDVSVVCWVKEQLNCQEAHVTCPP